MSINDITGDRLVSKGNTDKYRDNHKDIFGDKNCDTCGRFSMRLKDGMCPVCIDKYKPTEVESCE